MPAYTTKAKVQDYLALTIDTSLDTSLTAWIAAVSDWIDKFTGRTFEVPSAATTRKYDGNGQIRLYIDDAVEITGLAIDGTALSASDYFVYPANKTPKTYIELKQGFARNSRLIQANIGWTFTEGQQNVEVTGKFGYDASAVPPIIELAANKLVGGIIKESLGDKDVREVTQETLGDYSYTAAKLTEIAHALGIEDILKPYVRDDRPRTGVVRV